MSECDRILQYLVAVKAVHAEQSDTDTLQIRRYSAAHFRYLTEEL